jgi:hypothetical protein
LQHAACHRMILSQQRATPPLRRALVVATRAPLIAAMLQSISCHASWFVSFALLPETRSCACLALRWPFAPPSMSTACRHLPSSVLCMDRCSRDRGNGLLRCRSRWGTLPCHQIHRRGSPATRKRRSELLPCLCLYDCRAPHVSVTLFPLSLIWLLGLRWAAWPRWPYGHSGPAGQGPCRFGFCFFLFPEMLNVG